MTRTALSVDEGVAEGHAAAGSAQCGVAAGRRQSGAFHGASGGGRRSWPRPGAPTSAPAAATGERSWPSRSSADGIVYVMDSDAVVSAFDIAGGGRVWRFDTRKEDDDSTNVGGGLAVDQGTLYAVNGLAELVALDAAKGTMRWRSSIGAPGAFGAHRGGRAAVRHHDRGPAAGARHRGRAAALDVPGRQCRRRACWAARRPPMPAGWWSRASARANWRRCAPTPAPWSGPTLLAGRGASRQPGGFLRDPGLAGGGRRPGLRDRHGRPDGRASTCRPGGGCGNARSPARTASGPPAPGCSSSRSIRGSPRSAATTAGSPG